MIAALVERLRRSLEVVQDLTLFTAATIRACFARPFYGSEFLTQLHFATIGSLLIVVVSSIVAGQALAIQLVRELANTGAKSELGHFMVISSVRALGPVLTGMVVASRMSAGITAEIGAMRSSDQLDALVAFGSDPVKRLVVPRLFALVIALPALTIVGDALAVIGGGFVGLQYHLPIESYYLGVFKYLTPKNLLVGMIKHHQGAIDMVNELLKAYGAAQDETIFKFANDVYADQSIEIDRMNKMLEGGSRPE